MVSRSIPPVKSIIALIFMWAPVWAASSGPGPDAVRFLEKLRDGSLDLKPGGDTALVPQTSDAKCADIKRRLERLTHELGSGPLSSLEVKVDDNLAAVLVGQSSGFDPESFQVVPVAMVMRDGHWLAAPVPASFENTGLGYDSSVRSRAATLEDWLLKKQLTALDALRNRSLVRLRAESNKVISDQAIGALSEEAITQRFLSACRVGDLPVAAALLGITADPPPEDWALRLRGLSGALGNHKNVPRPWRLLVSSDVLCVSDVSEGGGGVVTLGCLDPAGLPPSFTKLAVESVSFHLVQRVGGGFRVELPEAFYLPVGSGRPEDGRLAVEASVASTFATQMIAMHPAQPQPSSEKLELELLAAFKTGNSHDWVKFVRFSDVSDKNLTMMAAVRRWWEFHNPAGVNYPLLMGSHVVGDHAVSAFQLVSLRNPDRTNPVFLYFARSERGWLWDPAPEASVSAGFDSWRAEVEKNLDAQWRAKLLDGCLVLKEMPTGEGPTPDQAQSLMQQWNAAIGSGDLDAAVRLTARMDAADSSRVMVRNLGYAMMDGIASEKKPEVIGVYRAGGWAAVAQKEWVKNAPSWPFYPMVLTPNGARILLEVDLLASTTRSREYLNRESLARLRKLAPDAVDALETLFLGYRKQREVTPDR